MNANSAANPDHNRIPAWMLPYADTIQYSPEQAQAVAAHAEEGDAAVAVVLAQADDLARALIEDERRRAAALFGEDDCAYHIAEDAAHRFRESIPLEGEALEIAEAFARHRMALRLAVGAVVRLQAEADDLGARPKGETEA